MQLVEQHVIKQTDARYPVRLHVQTVYSCL